MSRSRSIASSGDRSVIAPNSASQRSVNASRSARPASVRSGQRSSWAWFADRGRERRVEPEELGQEVVEAAGEVGHGWRVYGARRSWRGGRPRQHARGERCRSYVPAPKSVSLTSLPRPVERPPHPDLPAAVELAGAHQRTVGPVERPGAIHLAAAMEALQLHLPVVVVLDMRDPFVVLCHGATIAHDGSPSTIDRCRHRRGSSRSSWRGRGSGSSRSVATTWPTSPSSPSIPRSGSGRSWAPQDEAGLRALGRDRAGQRGSRHGTAVRHDRSRLGAGDRQQPLHVDRAGAQAPGDRLDVGRHARSSGPAPTARRSCSS